MIKAASKSQGVNRVDMVCDVCARTETIPCTYTDKRFSKPNEGKAISKITQMGWSYIKHTLRCPACEAKRKAAAAAPSPKPAKTPAPAREPTRAQKREIMDLLGEVYDLAGEHYKGSDTDDTVADVLDVLPGWVAQIREQFFGPDGANEDMQELVEKLRDTEAGLTQAKQGLDVLQKETKKVQRSVAAMEKDVSAMRADLRRIRESVGPRILHKAGV